MSLTLILVIMTSIISYQAFNSPATMGKLIFYPYAIKERGSSEWYRFLSGGFIHGDWGHLIINMIVLYQFGNFLEDGFIQVFGAGLGQILFILLYITAIIISDIPSYFQHQNNPGYRALGASGATSALVFGYILFNPWAWFAFPPLPALLYGVAFLWYSSYMEKRGADNIGHNAHFWGAVYGVLFTLISAFAFQPALLQYFWFKLLQGPTSPSFIG
jgi:membrane associated rhomboid family serine protease